MAKNPKLDSTGKKMIGLHKANEFSYRPEVLRTPNRPGMNFYSERELRAELKLHTGFTAKLITDYLVLSPRSLYNKDKGFLNVINCSTIFPDDPNIGFPHWSPGDKSLPTPGKIEIWLKNLEDGMNITAEIRLGGYSSNSNSYYEVRSSLAGVYGYFPIQVNSKLNLFFPDIDLDGLNMVLITVEPKEMSGSWLFYDAKINLVD